MPMGDESFYAIDGTEVNRSVLLQVMIDFFNRKYPNAQITDFNEGSVIRNILESIACEIFHVELNDQNILRACFLATSYGNYLDLKGQELHTARDQGQQAMGVLKFSLAEATDTEVLIQAGTSLMDSETGILFDTTADAIIPIGDTNTSVAAISRVIGEVTNAAAGKITVFTDTTLYPSLTVTNEEAFTGGRDAESDEEYRSRLLEVKTQDSFGSLEYYKRLGESVEGVHDVAFVDKTGYTAEVKINPDVKPLSNDILAQVTAQYTTEANHVYKHTFYVSEVAYTTVPLEVSVDVSDEVDEQIFKDVISAVFNGGEVISASTARNIELNYLGLNIGESVTNYQLLTAIESLSFVRQVTSLTSDSETFTELSPDTGKALKVGTISITQTEVNS